MLNPNSPVPRMKRSRSRVFHPLLFMGAALLLGLGCSSGEPTQPPPAPTPVPTTITLSATTVSFQSLGATQTLTATVKDQNGSTLSGQTTTWSSDNAPVASVSTSGVVTAVAQGTATITATSGSLSATASVTVTQVAASLTAVSGDAQTGTVDQQLAQDLVVQVDDAGGNPIEGVSVSFAVSGGGSLSATAVTTGADGRASTSWTLGTTAGTGQQVTASVTGVSGTAVFTATADPDVAANIAVVSGDAQTGPFSAALSVPLVVSVTDQFSNGVPGVSVTFTATSGGGTFNPTTATTDASGEASSVWTLGAPLGTQQAEATAAGLTGSPVPFSATSVLLSLTAISPDPIVEGTTATLTGTGFSTTLTDNVVLIDGDTATVTAAIATSLDVTVPSFSCEPARDVNVTVTLGGVTTSPLTSRLNPTSFTGDVALGQQFFTKVPMDFCLQFAPSATGGDAYIIGVGAAREFPTSQMAFDIVATAGAASPSSPFGSPPILATPRRGVGISELSDELALARMRQMQAESRLRAWERENLDPARNPSLQIAQQRSAGLFAVPPSVGDTIAFSVPDAVGNACTAIPITTVVRVVGQAGVFVTDVLNPTADSLTLVELQAASDTFDLLFDQDTLYFGAPSDIDDNQRVLVILTWEVNKFPGGFAGFVFSGDLFDPSGCASSDFGEIFYSHVPDINNSANSDTGGRSKASVLAQMPSLIAHEFTHVIQLSRRLVILGGTGLTSWEAEGQATFAEEVVGHAILGNTTGQNYDGTVATAANAGAVWYQFIFTRLARYFGWDPTNTNVRLPDAPELCTLYGSLTLNNSTACSPFWFYGTVWSFMRYLSDRFTSYAGTDMSGEIGLHRDWVSKSPTLNGVANVEALLGVEIDSLFARWAAMLYVDDRAAAIDSVISMTSWDLLDVFNTLGSYFSPAPAQRGFANFTDAALAVRGGSTRYTRVSAAGARPALAIRVQAAGGGDLGTSLNPQIWIVRTQ